MITLAELQRQFQQHVLAGDPAILRSVEEARTVSAATRLAIYSDAYRLRLIEALASNFPRLQQLLGDEEFAETARDYIASRPSSFRSVRWFGAGLPAALELTHPEQPWLADLAQWEWSVAAAFDARDAAPLGEGALAALSLEQWPMLRLEFHPSLQRLRLSTNAPAIFKALSEATSIPQPRTLSAEQGWLIWRQGLQTNYRSLDAPEQAALNAAAEGLAFAEVCDALCGVCEPEHVPLHAASLLKCWVAEGLIAGVRDYQEAVSG